MGSKRGHNQATDANQPEIVEALRKIPGVSVEILRKPVDLLVGYRHRNYLFEVKVAGGKLTPDQVLFFERWRGQVVKIETINQALAVMGLE